jgi:hypothetical protein
MGMQVVGVGRGEGVEEDEGQHSTYTIHIEERVSVVLFPGELVSEVCEFFRYLMVVYVK